MAIGGFLDTLPVIVFVIVHAILFLVALWAIKKASDNRRKYAWAFGLYALVHVGFLLVFSGFLTLKAGVFIEQILILIMVLWITLKA